MRRGTTPTLTIEALNVDLTSFQNMVLIRQGNYLGPMIVSLDADDVIYLYTYNQTGARGTAATKTDAGIVLNRIA